MQKQSQNELVEEIHNSFYNAGEDALNEAKQLISQPKIDVEAIAERYRKVGFENCKAVNDVKALLDKQTKSPQLIAVIEYFHVYYSNYKFILEADAKKICEKYGLVLGEAKQYKGAIPEKNLGDIEKFNLRKEDYSTKTSWNFNFEDLALMTQWMYRPTRTSGLTRFFESNLYQSGYDPFGAPIAPLMDHSGAIDPLSPIARQFKGILPSIQEGGNIIEYPSKKEDTKTEIYKPEFKICAPQEDFNTAGYELKEGYILVYDPVVLQPVKKDGIEGYLIITAWGKEATDENVINNTFN